jgi:hypothetical protein
LASLHAPSGERIAGGIEFSEERSDWRVMAVALDDDSERLRRDPAEFG